MPVRSSLPVQMDPIEFSQLLGILYGLLPRRCLEWGSGGSTQAVLAHCPFIKQYVSIEHDPVWYQRVRDAVPDPRLALHLVQPDRPLPPGRHSREESIAWAAAAEQDPSVMASYVSFPSTLTPGYDFILVDGRARRFCLLEAGRLLRPGAVLVLHDAQRTQYHDALRSLGEPVFFEPWKRGQLCLLRLA